MSSNVVGNLPLTRLPEDISFKIFSYLTPADLGRCCQVNSEWRRLASDNWVWREWGRRQFGEYLDVFNVKDFLREYHSQQLRSNDEIVTRIQDFATRVSLGHNGEFRCIIGTGSKYRILSVEIIGAPQNREDDVREFDIRDVAYASHIVGRGDLINPEPIETTWVEGPITQLTHFASGEETIDIIAGYSDDGWSKQLGLKEQIYHDRLGPFRAVLRFPYVLESETDFNTWMHFKDLEHPTQMQQKIANVLKRKLVSLKAQSDKEQNKRMLAVGVSAILLLSFVTWQYLNSVSSDQ